MIKKIIILAAGKGTRLKPLTNDLPKCLTPIDQKTILEYQIEVAAKCGIEHVVVVGGFKIEKINFKNITIIENKNFEKTNMVESLNCAKEHFGKEFILSYGDIIFTESILTSMMNSDKNIEIAADMEWKKYWEERFDDPLLDAETFKFGDNGELLELGKKTNILSNIESQYIGLLSFTSIGVEFLKYWLTNHFVDKKIFMTDMLNHMIEIGYRINVKKIYRGWLEIDSLKDLAIARKKIYYDKTDTLKIKK